MSAFEGLEIVTTDATLTGDGTPGNPLSVVSAAPSLTQNQIAFGDASNLMTSNANATYNLTDDRFTIASAITPDQGVFYNGTGAPNGLNAHKGFGMDTFGSAELYTMGNTNTHQAAITIDNVGRTIIGLISDGSTYTSQSDVTTTSSFLKFDNLSTGGSATVQAANNAALQYTFGTVTTLSIADQNQILGSFSDSLTGITSSSTLDSSQNTNVFTDSSTFTGRSNMTSTGSAYSYDSVASGKTSKVTLDDSSANLQLTNNGATRTTGIEVHDQNIVIGDFIGGNGTTIVVDDVNQLYYMNKLASGGGTQFVTVDASGTLGKTSSGSLLIGATAGLISNPSPGATTEVFLGSGAGSAASTTGTVIIGQGAGASSNSPHTVMIGEGAGANFGGGASTDGTVMIGRDAGSNAAFTGGSSIIIGNTAGQSTAGLNNSIAIGRLSGSGAEGDSVILIGDTTSSGGFNSVVVIGIGAAATATKQIMLGDSAATAYTQITAPAYPSTRDDTGSFTPVSFLYTDSSGNILGAPLSALSSLAIPSVQTPAYGTTYTAGAGETFTQIAFTTSTGATTVDLSAVTTVGATFDVSDLDGIASTSNITIDVGIGNTIMSPSGSAQTFVMTVNGTSTQIRKITATAWMVI